MRETNKGVRMIAAFAIPLAFGMGILWWTERKRKQTLQYVDILEQTLDDHLDAHYQERVDMMFHFLTEELDD